MLETETLTLLGEYVESIDTEIAKIFPRNPTTTLEKAAVDSLSRGGKRVRAVLALLTCELFSDDYKAAIPIAVAYELAHASALVQDDIIDSSSMRRGEMSIVAKYGLSNAILTSDILLFNVPKIVAGYGEVLDSKRLAKLFDLVGDACRGATWGEFLDLEMASQREDIVSEGEYEEMIKSKTASLLAAPAASGAIIGKASEQEAILAYRFGEWLGMAYQVHDDTLDLFSDEKILGKPIFTDLRAGKKNLILIHCLNHCSIKERQFLFSLMDKVGNYTEKEVSKARQIFEEHGSTEYAKVRSSHYINEAKDTLNKIRKRSEAKKILVNLTDYLSERYY